MGRFFAPDFGDFEITPFYSDNEIYCREVRFSVPIEKWSEFESSPMYRELVEYIHSQRPRYKEVPRHEDAPEQETERMILRSMSRAPRESFWARVRRLFQGI